MTHVRVGSSGLNVSPLCLGTMTFGNGADESTAAQLYGMCRDHGVDFFDCANVYAKGDSERILGRLIKDHRHQVLIATKAFYPVGTGPNERGLSRLHLTQALESSLTRLGTDYVDIYYFHNFDPDTPLEESLGTVNDFVRQGKVRYLGLSNFAAWQVMKATATSDALRAPRPVCIQPMYNLLKRQCESEILPMAQSEGLGVFSYSPLGGGLLTGKYAGVRADGGRFSHNEMYVNRYAAPENRDIVRAFLAFAADHGYEPAALAVAWVAAHPGITAPIIGARTPEQLATVLGALKLDITGDVRNAISALSSAPALANDRAEEAAGMDYGSSTAP